MPLSQEQEMSVRWNKLQVFKSWICLRNWKGVNYFCRWILHVKTHAALCLARIGDDCVRLSADWSVEPYFLEFTAEERGAFHLHWYSLAWNKRSIELNSMDVTLALVCLLYLLLAIDLICGFQKWQATTTQNEKKTRPRRDDTSGELRRTRSVSRTMMLLNRSLKGWEKSGATWRIYLSSQTSDSTSDSECRLSDNTQSCYCKAYGILTQFDTGYKNYN